MSERDIFVLFANALLDAIPESKSFKYCCMKLKRQPGHAGMSAKMVDMDGNLIIMPQSRISTPLLKPSHQFTRIGTGLCSHFIQTVR